MPYVSEVPRLSPFEDTLIFYLCTLRLTFKQVQRSTNKYACVEEGEPGDEAVSEARHNIVSQLSVVKSSSEPYIACRALSHTTNHSCQCFLNISYIHVHFYIAVRFSALCMQSITYQYYVPHF